MNGDGLQVDERVRVARALILGGAVLAGTGGASAQTPELVGYRPHSCRNTR